MNLKTDCQNKNLFLLVDKILSHLITAMLSFSDLFYLKQFSAKMSLKIARKIPKNTMI